MAVIFVHMGDITQMDVAAIVNAANSSLLGGGGVDGAIHRAAGKELLEACRLLNGCRTGEAKITPGFKLKARHVIHTVGPIWNGGKNGEQDKLARAYKNCLAIAAQHNLKSIAFPCISTGVYRFPKLLAAQIAYQTVKEYCLNNDTIEAVTFVCFDDEQYQLYQELLSK